MRIVFTKFLKVDDIKQEKKFTLLVSFELGKEIDKVSNTENQSIKIWKWRKYHIYIDSNLSNS